jgi:glutathione S-transferase
MTYPILYTFRRCPYAIRARMALAYAKIQVQPIEVALKNKPADLLSVSAKGTVPVLILEDNTVIDESMDIMIWALSQSDPDDWLDSTLQDAYQDLIYKNDFEFKPLLDKYKYTQHTDKTTFNISKDKATGYLYQLNTLLEKNRFLLKESISIADVAIFPFIRQFYKVDVASFEASDYKNLQHWLNTLLNAPLFLQVM